MEEFHLSYIKKKGKEKVKVNQSKNKQKDKEKPRKKMSLKKLNHSNSDTDFIIKSEKERRKIIRQYLNKKSKLEAMKDSKDLKSYKKGANIKKIIKKNKNELSDYIQNNSEKVKLFGNPRYDLNSPILFVEDHKKRLPEKKMGLVPLPSKKKDDSELLKEPKNLYDMQRNITMARRFQYDKKTEKKLMEQKTNRSYNNKDSEYFNMVQSWWKKMPKINDIQRIFRGYLVRRQTDVILKLYRYMKNFDKFLKDIFLRDYLKRIKEFSVLRRRIRIKGNYISKKRGYISTKLHKKIIIIENCFRCYKANKKRIILEREKKEKVINHKEYITKKIYINQNKINNNILKIQNIIKNYLINRNYVDKNMIHKNTGIYYYEKIYLNRENKKTIDFMKLMIHGMRLMAFKKKIWYKNPSEYDTDDLNKVKFIQRNYLDHYYNINNISIYNFRNYICYIDIIRKNYLIDDIILIQRQIKDHLDNNKKSDINIIRNKPIFGNRLYNNNNKNYKLNKSKKKKNESNINYNHNIWYISKEYIINVNNSIIPIQKEMHKYMEKIKEKRKEKKSKINKNDIHNNFFFTKEYSNKEKAIKTLSHLQKIYKDQYKFNKNNIINIGNDLSEEYSSLEDYTKPKFKPLRQLKFKNKIPKDINFGLYISKTRLINYHSKYTVNYNKNDILDYRQEGICITKIRYRNNDDNIKKIQNIFKKYKKNNNNFNGIQKPLTDNKNYYSFSSDASEDVIYTKKLNNYYYLSKITKMNFDDKVKTIQNSFIKHSNIKKANNEILNKSKILLNQKQRNTYGFFATKIRLGPMITEYKALNKAYKKPIINNSYISKINYYDNNKDIIFLQKNIKDKITKNNDKIILRTNILKNYHYKSEKKSSNKNNKNEKNNKNKGKEINSSKLKNDNDNDNDIVSLGLYLSKTYKRIMYKRQVVKNCFISKMIKNPEDTRQVNIKFLLLTSLFITKNVQQYIFNVIFKNNNNENFEYPFYLSTMIRVLKYLQSNRYQGNNVQILFNKIFSEYNSNNTIKKDLILLLTETKENDLRNTNIYNNIDQDFLKYIIGFSKFDKKLKNEKFLSMRLNNTTFHNTNIFTITKFIDDEFDKFLCGKYCYKCYLDSKTCKCFKSNDESTDEALDLGLNDNYNPKNSIKFFEYDNNKTRGTLIQGKPKIDDKDKIITRHNFNNKESKKNLVEESKKNNNLLKSKKKYDVLRYYDIDIDKDQNNNKKQLRKNN